MAGAVINYEAELRRLSDRLDEVVRALGDTNGFDWAQLLFAFLTAAATVAAVWVSASTSKRATRAAERANELTERATLATERANEIAAEANERALASMKEAAEAREAQAVSGQRDRRRDMVREVLTWHTAMTMVIHGVGDPKPILSSDAVQATAHLTLDPDGDTIADAAAASMRATKAALSMRMPTRAEARQSADRVRRQRAADTDVEFQKFVATWVDDPARAKSSLPEYVERLRLRWARQWQYDVKQGR